MSSCAIGPSCRQSWMVWPWKLKAEKRCFDDSTVVYRHGNFGEFVKNLGNYDVWGSARKCSHFYFGIFGWDLNDWPGNTLGILYLRSSCWMKDLPVLICNVFLLNAWIADGQLVDSVFEEKEHHIPHIVISLEKTDWTTMFEVSASWKALATCGCFQI